jgi:pyruvate-formate lyase-activating enzyme
MRILRVFVASPRDAVEWRPTIRQGIGLWNDLFSAERQVRFEPRDFSDVVASSQDVSTQRRIFEQEIKQSSLLVAIFSSTTGDENTLEEIAQARAERIPVFIYQWSKAQADQNLESYIDKQYEEHHFVGQFESHGHLANLVVRSLDGLQPAIFVARAPDDSPAESIDQQLHDLTDGDRVVVVGRTCVSWLGQARPSLREAVNRGVSITFVVQDLYVSLADPDFAQLRKDLTEAENGFDKLRKSVDAERRGGLALKYSTVEVRNSRVLTFRSDEFHSFRFDLHMAPGPKPYVVLKDRLSAQPLIEETLRLEQGAWGLPAIENIRKQRREEESLRVSLANAQTAHPFVSELRGLHPARLIRPAAAWLMREVDGALPPPLTVQILLSARCSTHCAMCSYFDLPHQGASKPLVANDFIELLNDVKAMGTYAVVFSGGEPLILPQVDRVIAHAHKSHLKVGILTSGVIGEAKDDDSKTNVVLDAVAGCSWIQVSVDSFQERGYLDIRSIDRARKPTISLERCKRFLHGLRARSMQNIEVVFTIQRRNIEELFETASLLDHIDKYVPSSIPIRFKFATGLGANDEGEPGTGEFLATTEQLKELNVRWSTWAPARRPINVDFVREATATDDKRRDVSSGYPVSAVLNRLAARKHGCEAMKHMMFVDSFGNVFPCCYLFNDNVARWGMREQHRVGSWTTERASQKHPNPLRAILSRSSGSAPWANSHDMRAAGAPGICMKTRSSWKSTSLSGVPATPPLENGHSRFTKIRTIRAFARSGSRKKGRRLLAGLPEP